ncbi:MAG: hypothetical protein AAF447_22690 [Myxococcota bacterium]
MERKKLVCLDFDGVLHSYTSGWQGAHVVADPPVPGAMEFLRQLLVDERFEVAIYSSRSGQPGGITAMKGWLSEHFVDWGPACAHLSLVKWPTEKPPAHITIDDRGFAFAGEFPSLDFIAAFRPWNRRPEALAPGGVVMPDLERDLATVLNRHSRENASNTPDFVLARYLVLCLEAFELSVLRRERLREAPAPGGVVVSERKRSVDMTWEERALALRDLLDDIDTFSDMFRGDHEGYRKRTEKLVKLAHHVLASRDGQSWEVPPCGDAVGRGQGLFVRREGGPREVSWEEWHGHEPGPRPMEWDGVTGDIQPDGGES